MISAIFWLTLPACLVFTVGAWYFFAGCEIAIGWLIKRARSHFIQNTRPEGTAT